MDDHADEFTSSLARTYFPRHLTIQGNAALDNRVDEAGILALGGNKVILGEPGMGKSELMRELARRLEVGVVTAIRFIGAKNPRKLVPAGKPLLIDGLDEAMSRREGDAMDEILAQLEEAESPTFILSCRSREWQARGLASLRQLYGAEPSVLTLEQFDRSEARAFVVARNPSVDADHILDHLANHGLQDLYRNPLTLGLMGRVAETDSQLPATRAALFERVCTLIWPEHDQDRQDEGLAQLAQDDALDAAGAIAAGLLFGGAEAASNAGAAQVQQGDIRLADLEVLPKAKAARAIFSSKLFHSVGPLRAKLIHRVIAEFLGARWVSRQATSPRLQRRVLAQIQGRGGVPASLRGLHAWLAYHSPAMAERVIASDPYGVLRYGETAALTPRLAECLFEALCRLAEDDPYFRAADWDSRTAAGLMIPALKSRIAALIASETSNEHLRSLLIEGLQDSPLAAELADLLESIVFAPERFYREREDAARALLPYRDRAWWRTAIATLTDQPGGDAPRLALQMIQKIDVDVSDELLVATIFAEMGVFKSKGRGRQQTHVRIIRSYSLLLASISTGRLVYVLELVAEHAKLLGENDWESVGDVALIVAQLVVRGVDEGVIGVSQAPSLWRWLEVFERLRNHQRDAVRTLAARLAEHDVLRRAVQAHVLANDRRKDSLWVTEHYLQHRFLQLAGRAGDIVAVFNQLALHDNNEPGRRKDWRDLVVIAWATGRPAPEVRAAAEQFRRGDELLGEFLVGIENPSKPDWEVQLEKDAEDREREHALARRQARESIAKMRDDLRVGSLAAIFEPALAYLDHIAHLPSTVSPVERLNGWLGEGLRDDALIGFEAVLHRTDLPTPVELARCFARGMVHNYGFPLMAGLYERMRLGKGIADLSAPIKQAALLISYYGCGLRLENENKALSVALEGEVFSSPVARKEFARIWIEPSLELNVSSIAGLHKLAHDPQWKAIGAALGAEWLVRFPNVSETVESSLVDCLIFNGALDALRDVAVARACTVFRSVDHLLSWVAIDVLVRFDAVRFDLTNIGTLHPRFIWLVRDRLRFRRDEAMLPLTVAQAEWIVFEFRDQWPYAVLEGAGSGDTNAYDATDFLRSLITRLADDTSIEAADAMVRLVAGPKDSYTDLIRHMAAEQQQKRVEENFSALAPAELASLLCDGPPGNIEDLRAVVCEELSVAQGKLIGDDLDSVVDFWADDGIPRDENRCRDRLAAMIGPELFRYEVQRITEADMPQSKRADLAFSHGTMQLPVEVKGQWHSAVWDAATGQLDAKYLIDWRSAHCGVYCVLWFGDLPSSTGRRLKAHPEGMPAPKTPDAMRTMLIDRVPESRRASIDVVVIDVSAGKPKCHFER